MDQSPLPFFVDRVTLLEQTQCGRKAYEKLQSALVLLDFIGADIAGAHVSQAIHAFHTRFDLEETWSKADEPLPRFLIVRNWARRSCLQSVGRERQSGASRQMGTVLHRVEFAEGDTVAGVRGYAQRLIAMAGDLLSLARDIEGRSLPPEGGTTPDEPTIVHDRRALAERARNAYRERRLRSQFFTGSDLFGEPAWDLLLDLFINANEGKRVPVTSACIGAAVPTTTALRWLTILESRGLVEREADSRDARRIFVRLTPSAQAAMTAYFVRAAHDTRSNEPSLPFMLGS